MPFVSSNGHTLVVVTVQREKESQEDMEIDPRLLDFQELDVSHCLTNENPALLARTIQRTHAPTKHQQRPARKDDGQHTFTADNPV
jgi:hypothetical protein